MTIIRIGVDTAKHVFQMHGVDEKEQTVVRRQLRRSEIVKFFNRLSPTRIGLEACGASHYWARLLRGLGHEVVLLPPQYIKPYVHWLTGLCRCDAISRLSISLSLTSSASS